MPPTALIERSHSPCSSQGTLQGRPGLFCRKEDLGFELMQHCAARLQLQRSAAGFLSAALCTHLYQAFAQF